jgi:hypothetical protein
MNCKWTNAVCVMCLLIVPLLGCHQSTAVVPGNSQPAATAPEIQIDPSNVDGFIDFAMRIFNEDMLTQAKLGPPQTFPPQPPNPFGGGPVSFAAYNKWLAEVADAVLLGTDPSQSPQYSSDAKAAYQEIYEYSGEHTQCLNVPTCKDVEEQRAELQGLDLSSVGVSISKTFANQSATTRSAASDYLQKTYSLANPNAASN